MRFRLLMFLFIGVVSGLGVGLEVGRRQTEKTIRVDAVRVTMSVIGSAMVARSEEEIVAIWTGFAEYADLTPEELNHIIEVWIDNPIKPPSRKDI